MEIDFNEISAKLYPANVAKGWWNNGQECLFQKLQLTSTEVAEGTEGLRKDLLDTHLKHRPMIEVELADGIVRMMDMAGHAVWTYTKTREELLEVERGKIFNPEWSAGRRLLRLNQIIVQLSYRIGDDNKDIDGDRLIKPSNQLYSLFIDVSLLIGEYYGLDVIGAMMEKMEYNTVRPDHDPDVRKGVNQKKF